MTTNVMFSPMETMPAPSGPPPGHLKPIGHASKRDNIEVFKLQTLRAEQPYLTRQQTSEYRHSFYHNLCLNILKAGYHRTFSELFHLIRQQEDARRKAGPDSNLWNLTPLNMQDDKLLKMRDALCTAEDAERNKNIPKVYEAYLELAIFFQTQPEDKWLVDHYFDYCLKHSKRIENDDNRKLAEAHLNMGLAEEENGNLYSSIEHFETFYALSTDKEWCDYNDVNLHALSCENLARVYTNLSSRFPTTEVEERLKYLQRAHAMAKGSGNRKLEGQCGYRLGLAYESAGKPDTALLFLRSFYESSKAINDDENLGLACEAMAKAYEKQGKTMDSIRFLEEFVEVTARSGQNQLYSRACRDLGAVYNSLGRYVDAAEFFNKAFVVARSLNDVAAIHDSRLQYGIAIGHGVMANYNYHIDVASKTSLKKTLDWKNSRGEIVQAFKSTLPDAPDTTLSSRKPSRRVLSFE